MLFGSQLQDLTHYDQGSISSPYNIPSLDEIRDRFPGPLSLTKDIFTIGTQLSGGLNLLHAYRTLAMRSPFRTGGNSRFSRAGIPELRYKARTTAGMFGEAIELSAKGLDYFATNEAVAAGRGAGNWVRKMLAPRTESGLMSARALESHTYGLAERYLLRPRKLNAALRSALGGKFNQLIPDETAFSQELVRKMYQPGVSIGFPFAHRGKMETVRHLYTEAETAAEGARYVKALRSRFIGPWEAAKRTLLYAAPSSRLGASGERAGLLETVLDGREFKWVMPSRRASRLRGGRAQHVLLGKYRLASQEVFGTRGIALEGGVQKALDEAAIGMLTRRKAALYAKAGAWGLFGADLVLRGARKAVQGLNELPLRQMATLKQLTSMEFGSGEVLMNSRLATERQRAVEAIQNASLNARYSMGSEASFYH